MQEKNTVTNKAHDVRPPFFDPPDEPNIGSYEEKQIKLRKIYLTINIDVNDKCFDELKNIEKLNIGDIIKLRISITPGELEQERGRIVAEKIIEKEGDLLIGFAIREKGQLENILQLIKAKELSISKIYYDKGKRREAELNEYKKKYALHSNWLDYSPEFVENQIQIFEGKVSEIKEEASRNNIGILAI